MTALYDIPLKRIDGTETTLAAFRGRVLLVVNVASKCGLTPQYEGLESLYQAKRAQGFEVLAFPANDFRAQEPGSDEEIQQFCTLTYDVHFPMFSKVSVLGSACHPLFSALTEAQPRATGDGPMRERLQSRGIETGAASDVLWNFEKFLLDRQGRVVARFAPDVQAHDPRLLGAVETELAKA